MTTILPAPIHRSMLGARSDPTQVGDPKAPGTFVSGVTTTSVDPYSELRFLLAPGEGFTQTYTRTGKTFIPPRLDPVTTSSTTTTYTAKFNCITTVTVPAGTFEACEYVDDEKIVYNTVPPRVTTTKITSWIGVGNGIPIKLILRSPQSLGAFSGDSITTRELQSAKVDGMPISP